MNQREQHLIKEQEAKRKKEAMNLKKIRLEVLKKDMKYGFLKLKQTKYGLDVITYNETEWYGKHTTLTHIPYMTKKKYIDLYCRGKI